MTFCNTAAFGLQLASSSINICQEKFMSHFLKLSFIGMMSLIGLEAAAFPCGPDSLDCTETSALVAAGCGNTCLNPQFLRSPVRVIDGVAYVHGHYYLGCDTDRPLNQQRRWHRTTLWYYYPPAKICTDGSVTP